MKRFSFLFLGVLLSLFVVVMPAFSASFDITLEGLPTPSGIEFYTVFLQVDDQFDPSFTWSWGDARPIPPTNDNEYPWEGGITLAGNILTADFANGDLWDFEPTYINISGDAPFVQFNKYTEQEILDEGGDPTVGFVQKSDGLYNERNLLNGILATITFDSGNILGVDDYLIYDVDNNDLTGQYQIAFDPDSGGVTTSVVPIPSTLLLLGGGLAGLLGLKRRKRG